MVEARAKQQRRRQRRQQVIVADGRKGAIPATLFHRGSECIRNTWPRLRALVACYARRLARGLDEGELVFQSIRRYNSTEGK